MSLRTRLLAAIGVIALVALLVSDVATYSALRSFLYDRIDQTLQTSTNAFVGGRGPEESPTRGDAPGPPQGAAPPGFDTGQAPQVAPGLFVERLADGKQEFSVPAREPGGKKLTPLLPSRLWVSFEAKAAGSHEYLTTGSTTAGGPQFRLLVTKASDGDLLVVGQPLDATAGTLHDLFLIELAVTAGALLAAALLGTWLVRVGLRPLEGVERTAEAIANGDFGRRVPGEESRTEVGRLARVLNIMLARIQRAFAERDATETELRRSEERLRRFVADASHELRTPVAAVSAYAELYRRGASDHPEDVDRFISGIEGETERMKHLVEDLLLLAKLDEGQALVFEPVELVELAASAVAASRAVGPAWPITLHATQTVEVLGDRIRLRQVLDNLLANVRAHTPPGSGTTVRVTGGPSEASIEVADDGPGLTDEQARHIFERFYRADPSRSRASGGSGLGLSIAWSIVHALGGTLTASAPPDGGASFVVRLPHLPAPDLDGADREPRHDDSHGPGDVQGASGARPAPDPRGADPVFHPTTEA
ncbi:MAG TPA: HAMP domain-containing sensor histidine kinase [Acidimicrobiales bacterium]